MKGPDSKKARPLAERLADLDARIQQMEARGRSVTPGEHTVADLVNDLRARCDDLRGRLGAGPAESPETHHAKRGTGATFSSPKDLSEREAAGGGGTSSVGDHDLEAAYRDLEEIYYRLTTPPD